MNNMLRIGHRGACGYAPENTIASFQKAIDLGVDMIEFDVHKLADNTLVIIHDKTLGRTTSGRGSVHRKTYEDLKLLNIEGEHKISTLQEVLDFINRQTRINIEIKNEDCAKLVVDVIREYINEKNWSQSDFLVSSFLWTELEEIAKLDQEILLGVLVRVRIKGIIKFRLRNVLSIAKKINAVSVHIRLSRASKWCVARIHQEGFKVYVYTVNNISDIRRMERNGVDGIFSNYPDRI